MGWESSDIRFDLWSLKRGYPNLKVGITHLLLVLAVCNVKPTCRKSGFTYQASNEATYQNEAKNIPSEEFVMRNISCVFKISLTTSKDSQPMISYRLVSHTKPLGPTIREI